MKLTLGDSLPFLTVSITYESISIELGDVLVDTGSASTVFSADALDALGIAPEPGDVLRSLRGVGGRELVFTRRIDRLAIGVHALDGFAIEVAGMS